jgi:hypothetical protein
MIQVKSRKTPRMSGCPPADYRAVGVGGYFTADSPMRADFYRGTMHFFSMNLHNELAWKVFHRKIQIVLHLTITISCCWPLWDSTSYHRFSDCIEY